MRSSQVSIGDSILASQYNALRNDAAGGAFLLSHEQNTPDLTLRVETGVCYVGTTRVIYAGGNSPSFTAPSANPRIDLLTIDSSGTLARTAGSEGASPSVPAYPKDKIVLAEVYCRVGQTTIRDTDQGSNGYIKQDVRPFFISPRAVTQGNSEIYGESSVGTDAYAITLTPAITSYVDGMIIVFKADVDNTGAATLSVNSIGAKTIKKVHDISLADGDIEAGQIVIVNYDATADIWQMQSQIAKSAPSATDFGDGSDSTGTFDGSATPSGSSKSGNNYTLTRDVYYTTMTISTGCTVNPAGYRIFVVGTLTLNGTGKIFRNGNNGNNANNGNSASGGNNGTGGSGGSGGGSLSDGYLKGAVAGQSGGNGSSGSSGNPNGSSAAGGSGGGGTSLSNSISGNGVAGGSGGSGGYSGGGSPGSAGGAGTATASNTRLTHGFALSTLLDINADNTLSKMTGTAGSGAGGGGGGGGGNSVNGNGGFGGGGGGGGGSGSNGGILYIAASAIVIDASAAIEAKGGNGGNGGNAGNPHSGSDGRPAGGAGGGGGGAGGNGGVIVLIYQSLTNNGSLSVAGGTKGLKGTKTNGVMGGGNGTDGSDGNDGNTGLTYQFQV